MKIKEEHTRIMWRKELKIEEEASVSLQQFEEEAG